MNGQQLPDAADEETRPSLSCLRSEFSGQRCSPRCSPRARGASSGVSKLSASCSSSGATAAELADQTAAIGVLSGPPVAKTG
jgi:hypothetical protein